MIFIDDYFDNHRLLAVTDDVIENAQSKLKVQLPEAYIALMQVQNGGELINRKLVVGDEVVSVDYINGIGHKSGDGILLSSTLKREWGLSNRLVYLFGGSHTWIALDYRRYKGNNPPVVYVDLELEHQTRIAESFQAFIDQLQYDETLVHGSYEYGVELEKQSREKVEREMKRCQNAFVMSSGIEYYLFTDEDLTWVFAQISDYVNDFIEEGYEPYKKPMRTESLLDEFLNMLISVIRMKKINIKEYPAVLVLLQTLKEFPPNYDYQGMIRNKAIKISAYFEL